MILGAGCGGLTLTRALRFVHAELTLVDRHDSHLYRSKLYAAAAGTAEPARLQVSLKSLLQGQGNISLVQGEALYLDARGRRLILPDRALRYDVLVVATGSRSRYGLEEWQRWAPGLRSAEDARSIREKLQDRDTAVVIAGGGTAGVELAAAVSRMDRMRRVILVDEGTRVLASFPDRLARETERHLHRLGVEIHYERLVIGIDGEGVRVSGPQGRESILSQAVLWAGGVEGSSFGAVLRSETGVLLDETGRVCVNADLTIPGHPEIFVIGDLSSVVHKGARLDGLATVAAQQGRYVGAAIRERMAGYDARPFEYVDQGRFAILGRGGVGVIGDTELQGVSAWLASRLAQSWSEPGDLIPDFHAYSAATGSST